MNHSARIPAESLAGAGSPGWGRRRSWSPEDVLYRGGGITLIVLFLLAFVVPSQIALTIGSLYMPIMRIFLTLAAIPILIIFLRRCNGQFYNFDYMYFMFVAWTGMCAILNRGLGGIEEMGQFTLEFLFVYMMAAGSITSISNMKTIMNIVFMMVFVLLLFVIPESINRQYYILNYANSLVGLPPIEPREEYIRIGMQRGQTIFSHPILYGVFCASLLLLIFELTKSVVGKIFKTVIIILATFFSLSSAPILIVIVQIGLLISERLTRAVKKRVAITIGGFLLLYTGLTLFTGRGFSGTVGLVTFNSATAYYRKLIWEQGIDDVLRNPIFGFRPEEWTRPIWMPVSVDNFWLLTMMRGGIPAALFLGLALIMITRQLFRVPDGQLPSILVRARRGWSFMIVSLALCAATVHYFDKMQAYFALMIGMGAALVRIIKDYEDACAKHTSGKPVPEAPQPRARRTAL